MPCEGCLRSEQYERPQHRSARDSTAEVKAAAQDMSSIPGQTAAKQYSLMTDEAPVESEDSSALNTSFVEQLNRTILQGAAYLTRRSACHARPWKRLEERLERVLQSQMHMLPRALELGAETRKPASWPGFVTKRLTFGDVFSWETDPLTAHAIVFVLTDRPRRSFPSHLATLD